MPQFINVVLTLLQYGGYILLTCIGAAIFNNIFRHCVAAYFAAKVAYAKELAKLAAVAQMAQHNGVSSMQTYDELVRKLAESETAGK